MARTIFQSGAMLGDFLKYGEDVIGNLRMQAYMETMDMLKSERFLSAFKNSEDACHIFSMIGKTDSEAVEEMAKRGIQIGRGALRAKRSRYSKRAIDFLGCDPFSVIRNGDREEIMELMDDYRMLQNPDMYLMRTTGAVERVLSEPYGKKVIGETGKQYGIDACKAEAVFIDKFSALSMSEEMKRMHVSKDKVFFLLWKNRFGTMSEKRELRKLFREAHRYNGQKQ